MRFCTACSGRGFRWRKGRCICDGWCHTPKECNATTRQKCRSCHGRGVTGKITVKCPTCKAEPRKACEIKRKHWSHQFGMHGSRLELAQKVAAEKWELERRIEAINAKEAEIEKLQKEVTTLWKEVEELEEKHPQMSVARGRRTVRLRESPRATAGSKDHEPKTRMRRP